MHAHLKALHKIVLQKKTTSVAINNVSVNSSSLFNTKPSNVGSIRQYFDTKTDNSLPAVISRLNACDGISFSTICNSIDIRQGLIAQGFSEIPKSKTGVAKVVQSYGEKIHYQMKN